MTFWVGDVTLDAINEMNRGTLGEHLGMVFTELGDDYVVAEMPVDDRTRQPYGYLHGGASAALAEHIGSMAANFCVDRQRQMCVGTEINASHLRPLREGKVVATARALRLGRTTQVWEVVIEAEKGKPVCISRLTMAVVEHKR